MADRREPLVNPGAPASDGVRHHAPPPHHPGPPATRGQHVPVRYVPLQIFIMVCDIVCALYSAGFLIAYAAGVKAVYDGTIEVADGYEWLLYVFYGLGTLFSAILLIWSVRCFFGVCLRRAWKVRSNMGLFESFGILFLIAGIFDAVLGSMSEAIGEFVAVGFAMVAWCIARKYFKKLVEIAEPKIIIVASAV